MCSPLCYLYSLKWLFNQQVGASADKMIYCPELNNATRSCSYRAILSHAKNTDPHPSSCPRRINRFLQLQFQSHERATLFMKSPDTCSHFHHRLINSFNSIHNRFIIMFFFLEHLSICSGFWRKSPCDPLFTSSGSPSINRLS